ncbi:hypothetical protein [Deinococcus sp.]|uniref:hypothetical protein n=1 Tax=Deinococcus sp. TaxID=47478 RepID=UPI003B5AE3E4
MPLLAEEKLPVPLYLKVVKNGLSLLLLLASAAAISNLWADHTLSLTNGLWVLVLLIAFFFNWRR